MDNQDIYWKEEALQNYLNSGYGKNSYGWYFNPGINEYEKDYKPENDPLFNPHIGILKNDKKTNNKVIDQDDLKKIYRKAVENSLALMSMPKPKVSSEKRSYYEEFNRRYEELKECQKKLTPELVSKVSEDALKRLNSGKGPKKPPVAKKAKLEKKDNSKKEYVEPEVVILKPVKDLSDEELENELNIKKKEGFIKTIDSPNYRRYLDLEEEKTRRNILKSMNKDDFKLPSKQEIKDGFDIYFGNDSKINKKKNDINFSNNSELKDKKFDIYFGNDSVINKSIKEQADDVFNKIEKESIPVKRETRTIVKTRRSRLKFWPIVVSAVMTVAAAVGFTGKKNTDEKVQKELTSNYSVSRQVLTPEYEDVIVGEVPIQKEVEVENKYDKISTGDKVEIPAGIDYHESSWWKYDSNAGSGGVFGSEERPAGEYTIDYISIFYNGINQKIEYSRGENIQNKVSEVAQSLGVSEKDLDVFVCITGPETGWIDYNKYIEEMSKDNKKTEYEKKYIYSKVLTGESVKFANPIFGSTNNFDGIITFSDENGNETTINLIKENGTLHTVGDVLKASNGEYYRIDNLTTQEHVINKKNMYTQSNRVNWSFSNINSVEALAIAAGSLLGVLLTYRRKEKERELTESEFYNTIGMGNYYEPVSPNWDYKKIDFDWNGLTMNTEKIAYDVISEDKGRSR